MVTGGDQDLAHKLKRNWREADLSDKHRAMLEFVEKLTVNPGGVTKGDMDAVLAAGWSVRDYYDIVLIASEFNFITRVADAFGVELDDWMRPILDGMGEGIVFESPSEKS